MGISSTTNRVAYVGNGSSTVFSFPYMFFKPADLLVYLYDTGSSIVASQTLNTNYTISGPTSSAGIYPNGANVVLNCAAPSSLEIIITRSPSPTQVFTLPQNGQIPSGSLVQQLDYLTTLVQRLQDEVARCVHLPDGLGPLPAGGDFDTRLPDTILLASSALAPIVVNSAASGFTFGFVITGSSGASGFSGVLPVPNGGTGISSFPAGQLLYATTSTQFAGITLSSNGGVGNAVGRDGFGNSLANAFMGQGTQITSAASSSILTASIPSYITLTGNQPQNVALPDATTIAIGYSYWLTNNSTQNMTVMDGALNTLFTLLPGAGAYVNSQSASTTAGNWDWHFLLPSNAVWGKTGHNLAVGSSVTGILPSTNGGTGVTGFPPQYGLLYASSTTQVGVVPSAASGLVLTSQGSSAPIFQSVTVSNSVVSKTTNYNATTADNSILAGSGCGAINLFGASGNSGKIVEVKKTGTGVDNVTIFGSSATIDGSAGFTINYLNQSVRFECDGTGWNIKNHYLPQVYAAYNATPGSPTLATVPANFNNQEFDSTGAVTTGSSWNYLAQSNGMYLFTVMVSYGINSGTRNYWYKNGAQLKEGITTTTSNGPIVNTVTLRLAKGDAIDHRAVNTSQTMFGSSWFQGIRIL